MLAMNFQQFSEQLTAAGDRQLVLQLPSGEPVPAHFHVTEVGKVTKDFIDCGGIRRSEQACVLQTLVANDVDHRLQADKLVRILEMAGDLGLPAELDVEFEVQGTTVQVFSLAQCQLEESKVTLTLAAKQTACLAPDQCGIGDSLPTVDGSCCGDSGCC
jgi:hypothetical protein